MIYTSLYGSIEYADGTFVKLSQSLNLSLSLRDRDRADTIITLYHHTTTNFLSTLELTYTQV